ncbi:MAG: repressor LexA [Candidatus Levybacteria bacterium RIFCSPLOWO2_12_FULL_39_17]|nr:MAG: LexA repressor [Candidatus Levybacteria bacterium GW2011_GWA1_39_11]OGH36366.1 MAG: repressor LexA [Candidatus Levybacteria bacterium RIFCSPLOWO2_01_FULL_38_120]OGH47098.1 MAG: repressor LexA [Candidatus Levybacteria bacterium RIFCSPLOWO2_12_FULL_39_17]
MRKSALTERQKQLLEVIYKYIKGTGYPPSFEEMKNSLGVVSNQSVIDLLMKLEGQKLIKRNEFQARGIVILPLGYEILGEPPLIPFLGISHAGSPITAVEIQGEWQQLSPQVAKLEDDVFILRVSGDSMINAGIDDGDKVLVRSQKEFSSGDIVMADVDGESTIKRFVSDDSPPYVYLKPENPKYDMVCFTEVVKLKGKVISINKRGQWMPVS